MKVPSTDTLSTRTEKVFITQEAPAGHFKVLSQDNWTAMGATFAVEFFIQKLPPPQIEGIPFTYLGLCADLAQESLPCLYILRRSDTNPIFTALQTSRDSFLVFDAKLKKQPATQNTSDFLTHVRTETASSRNPVIGSRVEPSKILVRQPSEAQTVAMARAAEFYANLPANQLDLGDFLGIPQPYDPFEL